MSIAPQGWHGWDEYAAFYDWENARTVGRRDAEFWRDLAARRGGPVLELGCGTGRVSLPIARTGVLFVGVDRSPAMLTRARRRLRRAGLDSTAALIRADIRALPFSSRARFDLVVAPYGILQSLLSDRDMRAALDSIARVTTQGAMLGIDLVPDVPQWSEYRRRVTLRGRRGSRTRITLIESVRQDRPRRLTIFDQEYVETSGSDRHVTRFSLSFRTLPVQTVVKRLARAGFAVEAILGDYTGGPWDPRADTWLVLARRV